MKTKLWYKLGKNKEKYPIGVYYILESLLIVWELLKGLLRFLNGVLLTCLVFVIVCLYIVYHLVKPFADECFEYSKDVVYTTNIDTFRLKNDIEYIDYDNIPDTIVNGIVLSEDNTFWTNKGIDIKGMFETVINTIKDNETESVCTITQQLAREVYFDNTAGVENRIKEILIALKLDKKFSKEKIIEFYCNCMNYANNIKGLDSASKTYFGKDITELSLKEQTYLCAIVGNPYNYNPWKNHRKVEIRSEEILELLLEKDYITDEEYYNALNETVIIRKS